MQLFDIIFYFFAVITVVSAGVVVFSRNVVYAAFALMFTFFGVAALYVLLYADFIAVTQVLVYVGGILVLMLFGLMLTNRVVNVEIKSGAVQTVPGLILAAVVAGSLAGIFYSTWHTVPAAPISMLSTTRQLGELLMTAYILPFEVASVVLLIALIGAAMLARRHRKA